MVWFSFLKGKLGPVTTLHFVVFFFFFCLCLFHLPLSTVYKSLFHRVLVQCQKEAIRVKIKYFCHFIITIAKILFKIVPLRFQTKK